MNHAPLDLVRLVESFAQPRIILVGDLMLDQYIYGNADRLSPEAPVPVVSEQYRETRAGGAGNVASDLAVLGAQTICVSIRGNDESGNTLDAILRQPGATTDNVLITERPTSTKTRLVGLAQHRHPQQMLRLDREDNTPISDALADKLLAMIEAELPACDLICIEDYNKGLLTPAFTQKLLAAARRHNKPVLVDPAPISDYTKYRGATAITPNRTEAERATGLTLRDGTDNAPALANALAQQLDLETCVLTLDRHGIYLYERGKKAGVHHPTKVRTVYDVTGAGDMVLAMLAMARAGGASWAQAADLANIAGGLEVERFGCVPIKKSEIIEELLTADAQTRGKQRALPDLLRDLDRHRKAGQRIVFTNGVFDILHAGHVQYLHWARGQGDLLVLAVNADDSVKRLKGPTRPVNPLADRMTVLAGLSAVDYVISFDADTPIELIRTLQPDVLVKGEDYADKEVVGRDIVEARGGTVVLAPFLAGRSTTSTIKKVTTTDP